MKQKDLQIVCENIIARYPPHRNFTSADVAYDAGYVFPDYQYADVISGVVSKIKQKQTLAKYGKKIILVGYSPKYGRNQKQPTNLLRVIDC